MKKISPPCDLWDLVETKKGKITEKKTNKKEKLLAFTYHVVPIKVCSSPVGMGRNIPPSPQKFFQLTI